MLSLCLWGQVYPGFDPKVPDTSPNTAVRPGDPNDFLRASGLEPMALPPLPPTDAAIVFAILVVALALFVSERLPPDITAIGVLVTLAVLEPWTGVSAGTAIGGFASPAVVTIVAMYILSAGIRETGVVDWVGVHLARFAKGSERRLLGATLGSTGLAAGLVNNTPVVAVFIPMVTGLAEDLRVSPSKFLLPLSFAAMLGGTLTLIGTSMNLLASDLAESLLGRPPIGVFEFTLLGTLVFVAGFIYLMTLGRRLTPARVPAAMEIAEQYGIGRQLAQVRIRDSSPLIGRTPTDIYLDEALGLDLDILQVDRERPIPDTGDATKSGEGSIEETFIAATDRPLAAGDVLTVRADLQALNRFAEGFDLRQLPREEVPPAILSAGDHAGMLVEAVIPPGSSLIDDTPADSHLRRRFDTTVLALRRGDELLRSELRDRPLRAGDTLLLQTTESALSYFYEAGDLVVTDRAEPAPELPVFEPQVPSLGVRAPLSVGILLAAVALAALTYLTIPITALGGVVAMVATGCLRGSDVYEAVSWDVFFLLAGVIPLGVALDASNGAAYIGELLTGVAAGLPHPAVIFLLFLLAGTIAAVITPVATVIVLIPIAVDLAGRVGADGFALLLATLFGASAAFATPIGYQTNLMVYGPGRYRFTDFARVGIPLQFLLAIVTTVGIVLMFPP